MAVFLLNWISLVYVEQQSKAMGDRKLEDESSVFDGTTTINPTIN